MSIVRHDIKTNEWIEIKYKGKTYLVGVSSLLDAWIGRHRNCCPDCGSPDPDWVHSTTCSIGGAEAHD